VFPCSEFVDVVTMKVQSEISAMMIKLACQRTCGTVLYCVDDKIVLFIAM
jgi:hypothetical protein